MASQIIPEKAVTEFDRKVQESTANNLTKHNQIVWKAIEELRF